MSDTAFVDDDDLPPENDDLDPAPEADDDLPPDEGGGDDLPADDDPPPRQESRAARTIRETRDRAQTAERERDELRRAIQEQLRPRQSAVDPVAEERAFQQRIADLPLEQQILAVRDRERQVVGEQLNGMRMEMAQVRDSTAFDRFIRSNPAAGRYADEAERQAAEYAANGTFVSREVLVHQIAAKDMFARGAKAFAKSRAAGARRIAGEQGKPGARRSDTGASGRRDENSIEALEERLRGKFI